MDYQVTDKWRVTGRYMKTRFDQLQAYGTTWAGNGSDQLPLPTLFMNPGSNYMLSATGIINDTTSVEMSWGRAANSLNYDMQLDSLYSANAGTTACLTCSRTRRRVTTCPSSSSAAAGPLTPGQYQTDRGPFTNENITHDVLANITKDVGLAHLEGRHLLPEQLQAAEHLRELQRPHQLRRRCQQPVRHGLRVCQRGDWRVQHLHAGQQVRDSGVAVHELRVLRAGQLACGEQADTRLRRALLSPVAAVGPHRAGLQLPARRVQRLAAARLYTPRVHRRLALRGANRRGIDPRLLSAGVAPSLANTVDGRFIGRLTPGSDRFNGAFQAGQGINPELQDGTAFWSRRASASSTTSQVRP